VPSKQRVAGSNPAWRTKFYASDLGKLASLGPGPGCYGQATRCYRRYFAAWYLCSAPPCQRELQHVSSGLEQPEARVQAGSEESIARLGHALLAPAPVLPGESESSGGGTGQPAVEVSAQQLRQLQISEFSAWLRTQVDLVLYAPVSASVGGDVVRGAPTGRGHWVFDGTFRRWGHHYASSTQFTADRPSRVVRGLLGELLLEVVRRVCDQGPRPGSVVAFRRPLASRTGSHGRPVAGRPQVPPGISRRHSCTSARGSPSSGSRCPTGRSH
jgi:hypothetical protein